MNDQFLFSDMPAALEEQPVTSVFLAIVPDQATAEQIARCAREVRARHGLRGYPRPTDRFHATLHPFDSSPHALQRTVQIAQMAAAKALKGARPFEARFDRVKSFSNNRSCVLVERGGNEALRDLVSRLKSAMGKSGERFTPHITLLYDDTVVEEEAVEPVRWMVNEIVLLKGILNKKTFEELERWPLQG